MATRNRRKNTRRNPGREESGQVVDEETVVVRNKIGETDGAAEARVKANNPGKDVIHETDIGLPGNPQGAPNREEKAETKKTENTVETKQTEDTTEEPTPPATNAKLVKVEDDGTPLLDLKDNTIKNSDLIEPGKAASAIRSDSHKPKFSSSYYSGFTMEMKTRDLLPTISYNMQIKPFSNERNYVINRLELTEAVINNYDFILQDVKSGIHDANRDYPSVFPGNMGFDPMKERNNMRAEDARSVNRWARGLRTDNVMKADGRKDKVGDFMAHPAEIKFQQGLSQSNRDLLLGPKVVDGREITGPERRRNFLTMTDSKFQYMARIPPTVDLRYRWYPYFLQPKNGNTAYDAMTESAPNAVVRESAISIGESLIQQAMDFRTSSEQRSFTKLLQEFAIRLGQFSEKGSIPASVSSVNAIDFVKKLQLCGMFSAWVKLEIHIDVDKWDLNLLIDCLTLKALTPMHYWDVSMVNQIDNYLARWFIPGIPGYNGDAYEMDMIKANDGSVNYLTMAHQSGALEQGSDKVWTALLTTPEGSGWLGAGDQEFKTVDQIPDGDLFVNHREGGIWYAALAGKFMKSPRDPIAQITRFSRMYDFLSRNRRRFSLLRESRGSENSVLVMLRLLIEDRRSIQHMVWLMDIRQAELNLVSFAKPIPPKSASLGTTIMREPRYLEVMSAFSAGRLIQWNNMLPVHIPHKFLDYGDSIRVYFEHLAFAVDYVSKRYPTAYFTRRQKLEKAFSMVSTVTGMDAVLRSKILGREAYLNVEFPDVGESWHARRFNLADEFVSEMAPFMGFTESVWYDPKPVVVETDAYSTVYRRRDIKPLMVYTEESLETALREETLKDTILDARDNNSIIEFKIPMVVSATAFLGAIDQDIPFDFSADSDDKRLSVKGVSLYRQARDAFFRNTANELAFFRNPEWFYDESPDEEIKIGDFLVKFHKRLEFLRSEWVELSEFPVVARNL